MTNENTKVENILIFTNAIAKIIYLNDDKMQFQLFKY
jgi:hypothetical protein